jgi:hypothetical protein
MAKDSVNITIDKEVKEAIDILRKTASENRNFSNMSETLMKEALEARGIKIKPKKK